MIQLFNSIPKWIKWVIGFPIGIVFVILVYAIYASAVELLKYIFGFILIAAAIFWPIYFITIGINAFIKRVRDKKHVA